MDGISDRSLELVERSEEHKRRDLEKTQAVLSKDVRQIENHEKKVRCEFEKIRQSLLAPGGQAPKQGLLHAKCLQGTLVNKKKELVKTQTLCAERKNELCDVSRSLSIHSARIETVSGIRLVKKEQKEMINELVQNEECVDIKVAKSRSEPLTEEDKSIECDDDSLHYIDPVKSGFSSEMSFQAQRDKVQDIHELPYRHPSRQTHVREPFEGRKEEQVSHFAFDVKTKEGGSIGIEAHSDESPGISLSLRADSVHLIAALHEARRRIKQSAQEETVSIKNLTVSLKER